MAITLPHTLAVGVENVTDVQDNFNTLAALFPLAATSTNFSAVPQCHAYALESSTSLPSGTATAVALDRTQYDLGTATLDMHSTSTNNSRVYCRVAGLYNIIGEGKIGGASTAGVRAVQIRLNGSTVLAQTSLASNGGVPSYSAVIVETIYRLVANDYVELLGYQTSGTTMKLPNLSGGADEAALKMCWVST